VARVYVNGLQVTKIHFVMEIASPPGALGQIPSTQHTIRTAFASYASADRDAVLARIQGIQKAIPNLDVFLDVASLRSGQVWLERLTDEIMRRDIFYLFWSKAASQSEWVRREWQLALKNRGAQFIDPVPLVDPQEAPAAGTGQPPSLQRLGLGVYEKARWAAPLSSAATTGRYDYSVMITLRSKAANLWKLDRDLFDLTSRVS